MDTVVVAAAAAARTSECVLFNRILCVNVVDTLYIYTYTHIHYNTQQLHVPSSAIIALYNR